MLLHGRARVILIILKSPHFYVHAGQMQYDSFILSHTHEHCHTALLGPGQLTSSPKGVEVSTSLDQTSTLRVIVMAFLGQGPHGSSSWLEKKLALIYIIIL